MHDFCFLRSDNSHCRDSLGRPDLSNKPPNIQLRLIWATLYRTMKIELSSSILNIFGVSSHLNLIGVVLWSIFSPVYSLATEFNVVGPVEGHHSNGRGETKMRHPGAVPIAEFYASYGFDALDMGAGYDFTVDLEAGSGTYTDFYKALNDKGTRYKSRWNSSSSLVPRTWFISTPGTISIDELADLPYVTQVQRGKPWWYYHALPGLDWKYYG
ncbi:hypothetical protein BJ508DRAFT_315015 [Ascobolus immersus RN42]|uniref:Uncharacterized protein n=1 Tax=Ascobolus immersus RN42 TaxID=1160509 RepID=A0A3N4HCL7_ASCIM|nr:hypothetical protein BJ508DRAFT_315015 [Ascobolus immersus RN42]